MANNSNKKRILIPIIIVIVLLLAAGSVFILPKLVGSYYSNPTAETEKENDPAHLKQLEDDNPAATNPVETSALTTEQSAVQTEPIAETTDTPTTVDTDPIDTTNVQIPEPTPVDTECGHVYRTTVTQPTCTSGGFTEYVCEKCGKSYTADLADALGHSYGNWTQTTSATCEHEGLKTRTCSRCSGTETQVIAKASHSYGDWTVTKEAACSQAGTKTHTCKTCGKTETQTIEKLSHSYGSWTTTRQPSCEVNGEQSRTCTKCGHVETKAIAATGHKWDNGKVNSSSGCGAGVKTYTCTVCGKTKTEKVSGANHTFGDWQWEEYTFDYTDPWGFFYPNSTGRNKYHVCTKCGTKEYADIPQHQCGCSYRKVIIAEPKKCGDHSIGYSEDYCEVCGYVHETYRHYDYVVEHIGEDRIVETIEYHIPYTQTTDEWTFYCIECFCSMCGEKQWDEHMHLGPIYGARGDEITPGYKDAQYYELGVRHNPNTYVENDILCYYQLAARPQYRITLTTSYLPNGVDLLDDNIIAHCESVPVARDLQVGYYNGEKCIVGYTAYWKYNGVTYSEYVDCTLSLKDVTKKYCAPHIQEVQDAIPGWDFDTWWDAGQCSDEHPHLQVRGTLGYILCGPYNIEWLCLKASGDHLVFSGHHRSG